MAKSSSKVDYYFVLGVPPDATQAELHAAWRRQLKYWHPDRHNHPDAPEHAKVINLAHDFLTDPAKRSRYDHERAAAGWRPSTTFTPPGRSETRYRAVPQEGRPPAGAAERHKLGKQLEYFLQQGRILIEKAPDLAAMAKWEAQTQTVLRESLGKHPYVTKLERALAEPRPTNLILAYGVLWAAYEDALKGVLKTAPAK